MSGVGGVKPPSKPKVAPPKPKQVKPPPPPPRVQPAKSKGKAGAGTPESKPKASNANATAASGDLRARARKERQPGELKREWQEKAERQRISRGDGREHVVGFGFAQTKSSEALQREVASMEARYGAALYDSKTTILLRVGASRPGSEGSNQRLSDARAAWLVEGLRQHGVTGRIDVESVGEKLARGTRMALDAPAPTDDSAQDLRDDADYRVAVITVVPPTVQLDFEGDTITAGRDPLKDDLAAGRELFEGGIKPDAERVRNEAVVPGNPFGDDPSKDPVKFLGQVGEMVEEVVDAVDSPKDAAKVIGKYTLGPLFEALVRTKMREESADLRRPLYASIGEGIGAALDHAYRPGPQVDLFHQYLYDSASEWVNGLSVVEKDQLVMHINEQYRLGTLSAGFDRASYEAVLPGETDGGSIANRVAAYFESNRYYSRE